MSASGNYCALIPDRIAMAAVSGVAVARMVAAIGGAVLSQPEQRDLIAGAKLLSLVIPTATQTAAVAENAGIKHPSVRLVSQGKDVGDVF